MKFLNCSRKTIFLVGVFLYGCLTPSLKGYSESSVPQKHKTQLLVVPTPSEIAPPSPTIVPSPSPSLEVSPAPQPQPLQKLSRFRVFTEFGPGIGIAARPIFFPFVGASFSPVDTCHYRPSSFCFQLLLAVKFGAGYALVTDSWLINPMFDTTGVFLFGQKKWWGLFANVGIGYGYSTTGYGNLHYVRLDLGLGLLVNIQPWVSRFSIYVRANLDPTNALLTFPIGFIFRF